MRFLSPSNPASENRILTRQKRDGKHTSLSHLLARDRRLMSEGIRRLIIMNNVSVDSVSRRFTGIMRASEGGRMSCAVGYE